MNHLESLLSEYLSIQGYIVVCNTKVGRLDHGGWAGELDVIAYNPERDHLVHYEPSLDANTWERREERFRKKFLVARSHILDIPQFCFLSQQDVDAMQQIAIFPSVAAHRRDFLSGVAIGVDDLMADIRKLVEERGRGATAAFPESYPLLRTLQLAYCGYYRLAS